ncbi:hypothetical protein Dda_0260 [Drechslerella dactyloides]|uniref:Uncharacterized protein n=1 Tax=Drechslerella dactyloides TaxID=74499 RepID=A0AAD6J401_DREDA|nr:hypothetical protein Dda_0260 [Drechslerella dactyloides]
MYIQDDDFLADEMAGQILVMVIRTVDANQADRIEAAFGRLKGDLAATQHLENAPIYDRAGENGMPAGAYAFQQIVATTTALVWGSGIEMPVKASLFVPEYQHVKALMEIGSLRETNEDVDAVRSPSLFDKDDFLI